MILPKQTNKTDFIRLMRSGSHRCHLLLLDYYGASWNSEDPLLNSSNIHHEVLGKHPVEGLLDSQALAQMPHSKHTHTSHGTTHKHYQQDHKGHIHWVDNSSPPLYRS